VNLIGRFLYLINFVSVRRFIHPDATFPADFD